MITTITNNNKRTTTTTREEHNMICNIDTSESLNEMIYNKYIVKRYHMYSNSNSDIYYITRYKLESMVCKE